MRNSDKVRLHRSPFWQNGVSFEFVLREAMFVVVQPNVLIS